MTLKALAPYVLHAHIQWLEDSGMCPHVQLTNTPTTLFPPNMGMAPALLFNISGGAVTSLVLDEEGISFTARFNGQPFTVYAPLGAIAVLQSKDGTIRIPIGERPTAERTVDNPVPAPDVATESAPQLQKQVQPTLTILKGSAAGDGIPAGKLTLVRNDE